MEKGVNDYDALKNHLEEKEQAINFLRNRLNDKETIIELKDKIISLQEDKIKEIGKLKKENISLKRIFNITIGLN